MHMVIVGAVVAHAEGPAWLSACRTALGDPQAQVVVLPLPAGWGVTCGGHTVVVATQPSDPQGQLQVLAVALAKNNIPIVVPVPQPKPPLAVPVGETVAVPPPEPVEAPEPVPSPDLTPP